MSDCNEDLNQIDEAILRDEVSDEAVEAASVAPGGFPTLLYGTYCFACPSRQSAAKLLSKDVGYITKITASALLPLVLGSHVQTAENEPKVTTLSCDGALTRKSDANKPIDMQELQETRVVVNLDDYTVFFLGYVVPISDVDQVSIDFGGTQIVDYGFSISIRGHIDRASGRIDVTTVTLDPTKSNDPIIATLRYDMACKATNGGG